MWLKFIKFTKLRIINPSKPEGLLRKKRCLKAAYYYYMVELLYKLFVRDTILKE